MFLYTVPLDAILTIKYIDQLKASSVYGLSDRIKGATECSTELDVLIEKQDKVISIHFNLIIKPLCHRHYV